MREKIFQWKLRRIQKRGDRYKREKELRDTYAECWPEKKTKKVSNIMLVIIVAAIISYALVAFQLQYLTGMEISSTLTGCWYAFWGTEIVSLALIRTSKVKHGSGVCEATTPEDMIDENALG